MREAQPLDDETVAVLEAIDATLHGEPVDPDFADFAELSLILRDECPPPPPEFLSDLDARAAERFVTRPGRSPRRDRSPRRLWWGIGSALGAAAAVGLVLVTVHLGDRVDRVGTGAQSQTTHTVVSSASAASAAASGANGPPATLTRAASATSGVVAGASGSAATQTSAASAVNGSSSSVAQSHRYSVPALSPAPRSGRGRDFTRSAQLVLRARTGRIDGVAQEVFDVIGAEHGVVASSQVVDRAHGSGSARFALQVPSGRLQTTLTRLSSLRGAQVSSRVDASTDITGAVNTTAARLAAAHSLRRSLLAQLAVADTATLAARLQASLRHNESQIVAGEAALARLHGKVTDSTVDVSVSAPPARTARPRRTSSGFTITRALHDAGRVLIVAAGVALIVLAVLVPLGLLVALGSWVGALTLQRRRERALGP